MTVKTMILQLGRNDGYHKEVQMSFTNIQKADKKFNVPLHKNRSQLNVNMFIKWTNIFILLYEKTVYIVLVD